MCGIAGVLYADGTRVPSVAVLHRMADRLAHRGPDGEGVWSGGGIGLAHRRLAIIDLAGGAQPLANEDGSVQIVFNGEIYNYRELRRDLERAGHRFRTRSDTEVLVHLYEERGDTLTQALRGMFAFALWDANRRRLLLARDRVGIKPLYVYRDAEQVIFGSELKAIIAHGGVTPRIDAAALEDYLTFGVVPGPRSILQSIEKLPAAHTLAISQRNWDASPRRYWSLRVAPERRDPADWHEEIRAKVAESVRMHLVADVPVGGFLSGGLDSSIVVSACAAETAAPIHTFSIGFAEPGFDELPYARSIAERIGSVHHEEIATPRAVELFDAVACQFDEPFADPAALPTYVVSRLARRHVKVAVSGDGGDEAFGGYARYAHDVWEGVWRRRLPSALRRGVLRPMAAVWPRSERLPRPLRFGSFLANVSRDAASAYANTLSVCRDGSARHLMSRDLASTLNGHDPAAIVRHHYARSGADDELAGMISADVGFLLPDDYLVKVDRASMAHGLEVRPPLLDHELLELTARIPSSLKVHAGATKWILKQAFAGRLPAPVVGRSKHGFDVPVDSWLAGPLADMFRDCVLARGGAAAAYIDRTAAAKLFESHTAGRARAGQALWSVLVLARWAEEMTRSSEASARGADAAHQLGVA